MSKDATNNSGGSKRKNNRKRQATSELSSGDMNVDKNKLNVKKINRTGWKPKMNLNKGLKISYEDFIKQSLKNNYNKNSYT